MRKLRFIAALFVVFNFVLVGPLVHAETFISGQVWENSSLLLTAPEGEVFSEVSYAFYGSPNDPMCGEDVTSFITVDGLSVISIEASNNVFGDPCPGVYKIFIVVLFTTTSPTGGVITPTTPAPDITIEPTPEVTQEPIIEVTQEPTPTPTETQEPIVDPSPTPVDPDPSPSGKPTPSPTATTESVGKPTKTVPNTTPTPEPSSTPEKPATTVDVPADTPPGVTATTPTAEMVLEIAEPGSPAYEEALLMLAEEAKADDPQLPEELAAIPVLGSVAGAVLDFTNSIGNLGADMSPKTRKEAKQTVIASVIATGAAVNAATVASVASSGTTGGSSSGRASRSSESMSRRKNN